MGHKRKRDDQQVASVQGSDTVPNSKRAKVEGAALSAAERRQLRSERKSKKASEARDGSSKKKAKRQALESGPELVKADPVASKDLMTEDFISLTEPSAVTTTKHEDPKDVAKRSKKEKKDKKKKQNTEDEATIAEQVKLSTSSSKAPTEGTTTKWPSPRSLRKEAKAEKAQTAVLAEYGSESPVGASSGNANKTPPDKKDKSAPTPRFICFVGNLPYDCTMEQLKIHFRALNPSQIRHATNKATGRSKGYAFLEFDQYDKMKTCLKVYHHSLFDPERTAQLPDEAFDAEGKEIKRANPKRVKGRKINVELTAGGGGASENRKDKISKKNQKLNEQRARRKLAEAKEAKKAEKKTGEQTANETPVRQDDAGMHPSRLKMMSK